MLKEGRFDVWRVGLMLVVQKLELGMWGEFGMGRFGVDVREGRFHVWRVGLMLERACFMFGMRV